MSPLRLLSQSDERFPAILEALPMLSERVTTQLQLLGAGNANETKLQQRIHKLESRSQTLAMVNTSLLIVVVVCIGVSLLRLG